MAVFRIEKNRDYTVMSNHHLRDAELTLRSKGLMSLMLSLPENWDYSMRGLACICKEGIDAIRVSLVELEKLGYIERRRVRNAKGQLGDIEYLIHESPVAVMMMPEEPASEKPVLENPTLVNPILANPALANPTQLNIDKSNTELQNTDSINYPSINHRAPDSMADPDGWMERYDRNVSLVKKNIEYDTLIATNDKSIVDNIVEVMAEVLTEDVPCYTIEGKQYPAEFVRRRYLAIDQMALDTFLIGFDRMTKRIHNPKAFLITSLFNIPATVDADLANMYRNDEYEDGRR